jgi:hypothetical protein
MHCSDTCRKRAHRERKATVVEFPDLPAEAVAELVACELFAGRLETKAQRIAACVHLVCTLVATDLVPHVAAAIERRSLELFGIETLVQDVVGLTEKSLFDP